MSTYPPVALPPTSNALSSQQRSALVRSTRKLSKVLGDVPRVPDDAHTSALELTRTSTAVSSATATDGESTWAKRKPTHLPPLLKLSAGPVNDPDSPTSLMSPVYHRPPPLRDSVLSMARSIVSSTSSTTSGSSADTASLFDAGQRRAKLERLRRKLGDDVPATAVFPTTPRTAIPSISTLRDRTRSATRLPSQADDARSVAFSISSDESVHTVTFTAARVRSSPRPTKTKHVYQTGPLPPVPALPAHLASTKSSSRVDDDAGLLRPRQKVAAGSKIGGADFKAARRAKREGRADRGTAEVGELVEMVGFMF